MLTTRAAMPSPASSSAPATRDLHLAAGADQDHVWGAIARPAARRRRARSRRPGRWRGRASARSAARGSCAIGWSVALIAWRQASAVSLASAGADHREVRRRAQVRRAARSAGAWGRPRPRPIESWVNPKIDGSCISAASRIEPLHVVAEGQERRAVGTEVVQREAVDDRAHRVLADAEVEVAAVVVAGYRRCRPRRSA